MSEAKEVQAARPCCCVRFSLPSFALSPLFPPSPPRLPLGPHPRSLQAAAVLAQDTLQEVMEKAEKALSQSRFDEIGVCVLYSSLSLSLSLFYFPVLSLVSLLSRSDPFARALLSLSLSLAPSLALLARSLMPSDVVLFRCAFVTFRCPSPFSPF